MSVVIWILAYEKDEFIGYDVELVNAKPGKFSSK